MIERLLWLCCSCLYLLEKFGLRETDNCRFRLKYRCQDIRCIFPEERPFSNIQ